MGSLASDPICKIQYPTGTADAVHIQLFKDDLQPFQPSSPRLGATHLAADQSELVLLLQLLDGDFRSLSGSTGEDKRQRWRMIGRSVFRNGWIGRCETLGWAALS